VADLRVDDVTVVSFAAALEAQSGLVGAECVATGQMLGSGLVQDALGNVSLVLTVLDQALGEGAGALARDARSSVHAWDVADGGLAMRAV